MKEKPIIFSTEMVRAILNGRKTMTRRVIKPQPEIVTGDMLQLYKWYAANKGDFAGDPDREIKCPYRIGMKLWVKETWRRHFNEIKYKADDFRLQEWKWKPSIFMPREASRITLEITNIEVERLQNITDEEAYKEGCKGWYSPKHPDFGSTDGRTPVGEFMDLWDSINKKRGYGWNENPWVWVISFKIIEVIKE